MAGMRVGHSQMTGMKPFDEADFFADVPVWSDFEKIEPLYPCTRWVFTTRDVESWFTSFKEVLGRYYLDLMWHSDVGIGALTGSIEQSRIREHVSYKRIFGKHASIDRETWYFAYRAHEEAIERFFDTLDEWRRIKIDVSKPGEFPRFLKWLGSPLVCFPKVR
jgi:hypothetical protein